jgi:Holliday junction resolvasome RuvABC endonuclease subunit
MKRKKAALPAVKGSGPGGEICILALDVSSTNIGSALLHGREVRALGADRLKGDLETRIWQAGQAMQSILESYGPLDVLAYEGPAHIVKGPFALIAQQRVVGVVLYLWLRRFSMQSRATPIIEVSPASAKVALAGSHLATKDDMIACARLVVPGLSAIDEHAADAVGVGLAAYTKLEQAATLREYAKELAR